VVEPISSIAVPSRRYSFFSGPESFSASCDTQRRACVSIENAIGICYSLGIGALPVAIWSGDLLEARRLTTMLLECAGKYGLWLWQSWQACTNAPYHAWKRFVPNQRYPQFSLMLSRHCVRTLYRLRPSPESTVVEWAGPWLKSCVLQAIRRAAQDATQVAEAIFQRSLDLARRQNALSWELRTATSLARLWGGQRCVVAAHELLSVIRDRFREGFQRSAPHRKRAGR
jgi:hypothetical protein